MITMHPTEERLNDYVDGELTAPERAGVEAHLAACTACRAEVEGLRDLLRHVAGLPREIAPPPEVWEAVREETVEIPRIGRAAPWGARWGIAAAVVVAALSSGITAALLRAPAGEASVAPVTVRPVVPETQAAMVDFRAPRPGTRPPRPTWRRRCTPGATASPRDAAGDRGQPPHHRRRHPRSALGAGEGPRERGAPPRAGRHLPRQDRRAGARGAPRLRPDTEMTMSPARSAAFALALALLPAAAGPGEAQEVVSWRADATRDGTVATVRAGNGRVRVVGWGRDEVVALSRDTRDPDERKGKGPVRITSGRGETRVRISGHEPVEVRVPAGSRVDWRRRPATWR